MQVAISSVPHSRYPNYTFISDNDVSKTAGEMRTRYSEMGLFGVVLDVLMLSECDYIVCTFSSQVFILTNQGIQYTLKDTPFST